MLSKILAIVTTLLIFQFSSVVSKIYGIDNIRKSEMSDKSLIMKASIKKFKRHIFIHVCTINNWRDILGRQLSRIKNSGLYDACESISLGVLGMEDLTTFLELYPKLTVLFQSPDLTLFERPTLLQLREFCLSHPVNHVVLYLHTKGVKYGDNSPVSSNVNDWARLMEYFAIDRWKDCMVALRDHDVCGVNWNYGFTPPFFEGNFWWATARYIGTLPEQIPDNYLSPELWIGSNFPNVKSFHQSGLNHYAEPYPESKYVLEDK